VVGSSVQTGAGATDVVGAGSYKLMCLVAWCGHLESSHTLTRETIFGTIVGVFGGDGCGVYVVGVERTIGRT